MPRKCHLCGAEIWDPTACCPSCGEGRAAVVDRDRSSSLGQEIAPEEISDDMIVASVSSSRLHRSVVYLSRRFGEVAFIVVIGIVVAAVIWVFIIRERYFSWEEAPTTPFTVRHGLTDPFEKDRTSREADAPTCPKGTKHKKSALPDGGKEEWCERAGKMQGPYRKWHKNGQKAAEGEYENGMKRGKWTTWCENGQRETEGEIRDGEEHGKWAAWYENGQKIAEGEFREGKAYGIWTAWFENGQRESEGEAQNDEKHGKWTFWYESGQIKAIGRYHEGKLCGLYKMWDEVGRPMPVEDPECTTIETGAICPPCSAREQEGAP